MSTYFDFDLIGKILGEASESKEKALADHTTAMDPNSTKDILKLQQLMHEWSIMTNLQSATIKTLKDVVSGVLQKM